MRGLRGLDLAKPPGVAETIDWAQALAALGRQDLDAEVVEQTLGSVLKYHEDLETVRDAALAMLVEEARALPAEAARPRRSSRSAGCCARPGSRSARAGSSTRCTASTRSSSTRRDDVYWTLRQTLVSRADDLEAFDRAFAAWFLRAPELRAARGRRRRSGASRQGGSRRRHRRGGRGGRGGARSARPGWSAEELLRQKDFSELTRRGARRRCGG